jgi:hypothetical protein
MIDILARRMAEVRGQLAALGSPAAGLVPLCRGQGHKSGRRPVGHVLCEEQEVGEVETYTYRPVDEPVFLAGEGGGCGRTWVIREPGAETAHVCSRPAGHAEGRELDLHRCADGCWWRGPDGTEGQWQARYLVWSLSRKAWIDAAGSGYVPADQVDAAGRFDWHRADEYCTHHVTEMRHWAPTPTWPAGAPLPAIRIPETGVRSVAAGVRTLAELIRSEAAKQIPGWEDYWLYEKGGEVYDPWTTSAVATR